MMRGEAKYVPPALTAGFVAFALAIILSLADIRLALIPLCLFVLLCLAAPFFPSRGFFLQVFSRGHTGRPVVSLTFDDGPEPETTRELLQILKKESVRAVFYVIGEKAARHRELIVEILEHGHDIGNHSFTHDPFVMLRPARKLHDEIASTQALLSRFGVLPLTFRPPVGITNPKLAAILARQGLYCVTFACRAFDRGNKNIGNMAARILKKVKPDDIIMLHDVSAHGVTDTKAFLNEVELILSGLKVRGLHIVPLAELLNREVMLKTGKNHGLQYP